MTERRLGAKYLTKISEEEAGSTLEVVNKLKAESLVMDNFLKEVSETQKENEELMKAAEVQESNKAEKNNAGDIYGE